ncbi:MAG: peptide-methionine (S)-S-oxide reductase MsrA [Oscillospiraceae bacterium]|nr:peptide-methionine (S)-S-oxide reductase MsrA [Oscillospiraceae bacterium]
MKRGVASVKTIYLAGGCFWGTQHFFEQFSGVLETKAGYANGRTVSPSYEDVRYRDTGHAETVMIRYDEEKLPTEKLLSYYFLTIDPLSINRQGADIGSQYRTGIYYDDETLLDAIQAAVAAEEAKVGAKLEVEVLPLRNFYPAEEYHQDYLVKNPGGYCHIPLHLMHLEERE